MDPVIQRFLEVQYQEGMALAAASDLLKLRPIHRGDGAPQRYIAEFHCHGFVENHGQISKADRFCVGLYFSDCYLRQANTAEVLTWLHPTNVHHPNIHPPYVCVGDSFMRPGTRLVEIIYQLYSIIAYQRFAAHSPLNEAAAQWARGNQHLLPADKRPLKRRPLDLRLSVNAAGGAS